MMVKVSIPNVLGGLLELPNGEVIELESVQGLEWLARPDFRSFRFEDGISPYTCRKEKVKGTDGYWYGYRRVDGKVTKRYIGKTTDLTQARLIEVSNSFQGLPKKHTSLPKSSSVLSNELDDELAKSMLPRRLGNMDLGNKKLVYKLPFELRHESLDNLKAELAQLKTDGEHLKQELLECHQTLDSCQRSCTQLQEALEPAKLLNRLRQQNKRSKVTLRDLEEIVSLIVDNWQPDGVD